MLVAEKIVDNKPRLEFKYKIQTGPSTIKSYGLALARCLRFPSSLIDRAEELVERVTEETFLDLSDIRNKGSRGADATRNSSVVAEAITDLDKDVIDLYSHVLLLMSTDQNQPLESISVNAINQKVERLIKKMSPDLRQMIEESSLEEVVIALNGSKATENSF